MHLKTPIMLKNKAPKHLVQLNIQWTLPHTRAITDLADATQTTTNFNNQTMNFGKLPHRHHVHCEPRNVPRVRDSGRNNVNRPSANTCILSPYPAWTTGCSQVPGWRWDSGLLWPFTWLVAWVQWTKQPLLLSRTCCCQCPWRRHKEWTHWLWQQEVTESQGSMNWSNQESYILDSIESILIARYQETKAT